MFSKLYNHEDGVQIANDARIIPPTPEIILQRPPAGPLMLSRLGWSWAGVAWLWLRDVSSCAEMAKCYLMAVQYG